MGRCLNYDFLHLHHCVVKKQQKPLYSLPLPTSVLQSIYFNQSSLFFTIPTQISLFSISDCSDTISISKIPVRNKRVQSQSNLAYSPVISTQLLHAITKKYNAHHKLYRTAFNSLRASLIRVIYQKNQIKF